jgi:hypothetical protein
VTAAREHRVNGDSRQLRLIELFLVSPTGRSLLLFAHEPLRDSQTEGKIHFSF